MESPSIQCNKAALKENEALSFMDSFFCLSLKKLFPDDIRVGTSWLVIHPSLVRFFFQASADTITSLYTGGICSRKSY
jgi:hypothetical protein